MFARGEISQARDSAGGNALSVSPPSKGFCHGLFSCELSEADPDSSVFVLIFEAKC